MLKYFIMPLTKEEDGNGNNKGYKFALEHEDRWIPIDPIKDEINTFDRGCTHVVVENVVYTLFKDYVDATRGHRVYVVINKGLESDILPEYVPEVEPEPAP